MKHLPQIARFRVDAPSAVSIPQDTHYAHNSEGSHPDMFSDPNHIFENTLESDPSNQERRESNRKVRRQNKALVDKVVLDAITPGQKYDTTPIDEDSETSFAYNGTSFPARPRPHTERDTLERSLQNDDRRRSSGSVGSVGAHQSKRISDAHLNNVAARTAPKEEPNAIPITFDQPSGAHASWVRTMGGMTRRFGTMVGSKSIVNKGEIQLEQAAIEQRCADDQKSRSTEESRRRESIATGDLLGAQRRW